MVSVLMVVVFSAGMMSLVITPLYAIVLALGLVICALVFILGIANPNWVLYITVFVILLPAGLIPGGFQSILNRSLTVAAFGSWLANALIKRQKIALPGAAVAMLIFIFWSIVTVFGAQYTTAATTTIQTYLLRFILFLILIPNVINSPQRLKNFLLVMALAGWVLLLTSLVLIIQNGVNSGERFKILGVNENDAGLIALITLIGALGLAHYAPEQKTTINKILAGIFLALAIGLTALSGSRGSAISVVGTIALFGIWKSTRSWAKLSVFILILGAIFMPNLFTTTIQRFMQSSDNLLGERGTLWLGGWQLVRSHPLFGVGIGGSPYAILPFIQSLTSNGGSDGISIHNPILVVWSETGIFGIVFYLAILVSAIASFFKQYVRYRAMDTQQHFMPYFYIVTAVLLGYMMSWIKGGGMQTSHMYFLLLSLLLIPANLDAQKTIEYER